MAESHPWDDILFHTPPFQPGCKQCADPTGLGLSGDEYLQATSLLDSQNRHLLCGAPCQILLTRKSGLGAVFSGLDGAGLMDAGVGKLMVVPPGPDSALILGFPAI